MSKQKLKVSAEVRAKLDEAYAYCNAEDKSTPFTIQYLQDMAGVDFDTALRYLEYA